MVSPEHEYRYAFATSVWLRMRRPHRRASSLFDLGLESRFSEGSSNCLEDGIGNGRQHFVDFQVGLHHLLGPRPQPFGRGGVV